MSVACPKGCPLDPAAYLALAASLLEVARPGALFPEVRRVAHWLGLLGLPGPGGRSRRIAVHPASGLPSLRGLAQLHRLKVAAQAVTLPDPRRSASGRRLTQALLAAELPPMSASVARLVGREGRGHRFLLVHERLDAVSGCPVRYTAQLEQQGGRHLTVDRAEQAHLGRRFGLELALACSGTAEEALLALGAVEGLAVREVVRGQLGPLTTALGGEAPFRPVVAGGGGVLALVLERAGGTVRADHDGDPWASLDASVAAAGRRAALGYRVARERRLVCTPEVEAAVRSLASATHRALVIRSA